MNITRHLRISGRVQGVGYRASLRAEAQGDLDRPYTGFGFLPTG